MSVLRSNLKSIRFGSSEVLVEVIMSIRLHRAQTNRPRKDTLSRRMHTHTFCLVFNAS